MKLRLPIALATILIATMFSSAVHAETYTWTGADKGLITAAANWNPALPSNAWGTDKTVGLDNIMKFDGSSVGTVVYVDWNGLNLGGFILESSSAISKFQSQANSRDRNIVINAAEGISSNIFDIQRDFTLFGPEQTGSRLIAINADWNIEMSNNANFIMYNQLQGGAGKTITVKQKANTTTGGTLKVNYNTTGLTADWSIEQGAILDVSEAIEKEKAGTPLATAFNFGTGKITLNGGTIKLNAPTTTLSNFVVKSGSSTIDNSAAVKFSILRINGGASLTLTGTGFTNGLSISGQDEVYIGSATEGHGIATINNALNFNGGTIFYYDPADTLKSTGVITFGATPTIVEIANPQQTTYTLFQGTDFVFGTGDIMTQFTLKGVSLRYCTLADNGTTITLNVTSTSATPPTLTWKGGDGLWGNKTGAIWNSPEALDDYHFFNSDNVVFDGTAAGSLDTNKITVENTILPSSITIKGGKTFEFTGATGTILSDSIEMTSTIANETTTLNITGGITVSAKSYVGAAGENSKAISNVNIGGASGAASLTILGGTGAKFILSESGHGSGTDNISTFSVLTGGVLTSETLALQMAIDGSSVFNVNGGTAKLLGIDMTADANKTHSVIVNEGVLNIGTGGITVTADNKGDTVKFGNATIGAWGSWTSNSNITLGYSETATAGTINTIFDTNYGATTGTGYTITLNGILSDASATSLGSLTKNGAGTLILGKANTYSGGTTINAGTVQAKDVAALGTGAIVLNGGGLLNSSGAAMTLSQDITATGNSSLGSSEANSSLTVTGNLNAAGKTITITDSRLASNDSTQNSNIILGATTPGKTQTIGTLINDRGSITFNGAITIDIYRGSWQGTNAGARTLTIVEGADVHITGTMTPRHETNGTTTFNMTGGKLTVDGQLQLARDGTTNWTLTGGIANINQLNMNSDFDNVSKVRSINLNTGGTLNMGTGGIKFDNAATIANINLNGGTLGATANWESASARLLFNLQNLDGTTINTEKSAGSAEGYTITLKSLIQDHIAGSGDTAVTTKGKLIKAGAGTLILDNPANKFTGELAVIGGILKPTSTGAVATASSITLGEGGTFEHSYAGDVTSNITGTGKIKMTQEGMANFAFQGSAFEGSIELSNGQTVMGTGVASTTENTFNNDKVDLVLDKDLFLNTQYSNASNGLRLGNISGTGGQIRADLNGNTGVRYLSVTQTTNGEFNGVFALSNNASVSLIKQGTATLTLTNANTSTSNLIIKEGALQIGNGGATGSWAGNIVFDAKGGASPSLILNRTNETGEMFVWTQAISGNGTVVITGAKGILMNVANSHTVGTTVEAGSTLFINNAGALGSSTATLNLKEGSKFASYNTIDYTINNRVEVLGNAQIGDNEGHSGKMSFNQGLNFQNNSTLNFYNNTVIGGAITGAGLVNILDNMSATINLDNSPTAGFIGKADGVTTIAEMNLTLGNNSQLVYQGNTSTQYIENFTYSSLSTINFNDAAALKLNISKGNFSTTGNILHVDNYALSQDTYIRILDDTIARDTELGNILIFEDGAYKTSMINAFDYLVVFDATPSDNTLLDQEEAKGTVTYSTNETYFGANEEGVDFSGPITFGPDSPDHNYRFTINANTTAAEESYSFSVSTALSNGDDASRGVYILGSTFSKNKVVTLSNGGNSFTGNVNVSMAGLKVVATPGTILDPKNVTILGINNMVNLGREATLDLATGTSAYTYNNKIQFTNNFGALIKQTVGQHTLAGDIGILGSGTHTIANESTALFTLSGRLLGYSLEAGFAESITNNTLVLQGGTTDSTKILVTAPGSQLSNLVISGIVEFANTATVSAHALSLQDNANLIVQQATITLGEGGITQNGGGTSLITMNGGSLIADASFSTAAPVSFVMNGNNTINTQAHNVSMGGIITNKLGEVITKQGAGELSLTGNLDIQGTLLSEQGNLNIGQQGSDALINIVDVSNGILTVVEGATLTSKNIYLKNNATLAGTGNINTEAITFGMGSKYTGKSKNQTWLATFQSGSRMEGILEDHQNRINFRDGSVLQTHVNLISGNNIVTNGQISTKGKNNYVQFSGLSIEGSTETAEHNWVVGDSYSFTLINSEGGLRDKNGKRLNKDSIGDSVKLANSSWNNFLNAGLTIEGNTLNVILTRNAEKVSQYAQTSNQKAIAGSVDYIVDNVKTLNIVGTELDDIVKLFANDNNLAAHAPRNLNEVGGITNYQAIASQRNDLLRHTEAVRQRANAGKGMAGYSSIPDNQFWVEGTQSYNTIDSTANAPGYKGDSFGAAMGVDYLAAAKYSLGVAFAYSHHTTTAQDMTAKSKADSYYVDLYGRWESGAWSGVGALSGGTTSSTIERTATYSEENHFAKSSADGMGWMAMTEVAYNIVMNEENRTFQPFVMASVGSTSLDGYSESGMGNAGLTIDKQTNDIAQIGFGVRIFQSYIDTYYEYEKARWEVRALVIQELGDTDYNTKSAFIGAPDQVFQTQGQEIDKTGFIVGAGASKSIDQNWSVFADVNAEFRSSQSGMNSTLGLRCTF